MIIMIGQTRPRGQPKKTAKSLVRQDDGISSDTSSSAKATDSEPSRIKKVKAKKVAKKAPSGAKRGRKPKDK